jgi:hypothetical protein
MADRAGRARGPLKVVSIIAAACFLVGVIIGVLILAPR